MDYKCAKGVKSDWAFTGVDVPHQDKSMYQDII